MPEVHEQLREILRTLERHYGDMQDTEFTVEEGRLYMLQTRNAKRPAQAAVRFARDAVAEGLLSREQALMTIDAGSWTRCCTRRFDPAAELRRARAWASPASPGAAKGEVVFTAADAVAATAEGRDVILARPFTDADDVAGFAAAKGILTTTGGKASHAALVARGMGRPAITGAASCNRRRGRKLKLPDGQELAEGDFIAINGSTGEITTDDVPADRARRLVRARDGSGLGRRAAPARRTGQRRRRRVGRPAPRARRRGHRPVPQRAHVPRRPHPPDGRRDPGRRRRGARRGDRAPVSPAGGRLRAHPGGDGRSPGVRAPARPAAERVPARPRRAPPRGRTSASGVEALDVEAGEPDARHPRGAARDPPARPLRDAGAARCSAPAQAGAREPTSRSWSRWSTTSASSSSSASARPRGARRS